MRGGGAKKISERSKTAFRKLQKDNILTLNSPVHTLSNKYLNEINIWNYYFLIENALGLKISSFKFYSIKFWIDFCFLRVINRS